MGKGITTGAIIFAIIALALGMAFVPKEVVDEYGVLLLFVPVIILFLIIGFAIFMNNKSKNKTPGHEKIEPAVEKKNEEKKPQPPRRLQKNAEENKTAVKTNVKEEVVSVKDLETQMSQVQEEIKGAEHKFLKHKIDTPTFNSITQDANGRLISIEAQIDTIKNKDLSGPKMRKMQYVSNDKQDVLEKLLNEKMSKVQQLKIAEKKYLKRKISVETYQKITSDVNKEIISIESRIKALHKASEIDKIKLELKSSLVEVDKQKAISKKRVEEQLEEDIISQLPF